MGNALRGAGRLDGALASYPRAIDLRPDYMEAHISDAHLMDGMRFARGIENAYRAMWRDWCEGEVRR